MREFRTYGSVGGTGVTRFPTAIQVASWLVPTRAVTRITPSREQLNVYRDSIDNANAVVVNKSAKEDSQ